MPGARASERKKQPAGELYLKQRGRGYVIACRRGGVAIIEAPAKAEEFEGAVEVYYLMENIYFFGQLFFFFLLIFHVHYNGRDN